MAVHTDSWGRPAVELDCCCTPYCLVAWADSSLELGWDRSSPAERKDWSLEPRIGEEGLGQVGVAYERAEPYDSWRPTSPFGLEC